MSRKAIIVAANPYRYYRISDTEVTKELGDVELHREHLSRHNGVFWDIIPPGRVDTPWKHPDINSGYFYMSREGRVKYRMSIEYIRQWKDIDLVRAVVLIPDCRRSYLESYKETLSYYAILIRELEPLQTHRYLREFTLVSTNRPVERVQNYVIVYDPEYE